MTVLIKVNKDTNGSKPTLTHNWVPGDTSIHTHTLWNENCQKSHANNSSSQLVVHDTGITFNTLHPERSPWQDQAADIAFSMKWNMNRLFKIVMLPLLNHSFPCTDAFTVRVEPSTYISTTAHLCARLHNGIPHPSISWLIWNKWWKQCTGEKKMACASNT